MAENNAENRDYLYALADKTLQLTPAGQRFLAAQLIVSGLMIASDIPRSWIETDADRVVDLFLLLDQIYISYIIDRFIDHMVAGKDTTPNTTAVGGFNQTELFVIEQFVDIAKTL